MKWFAFHNFGKPIFVSIEGPCERDCAVSVCHHNLVIIFHFRYKTLHFNDYVSGAKSCIELIAVRAANQEEKMDTKSYLRSFERFINYLQHFDDLNIHFEMNEHHVWDTSRPRVIDSVNPYNNLAKNWDRKSIELVKHYAKETKNRLDFLANRRLVHLNQLFEPQPVFSPDINKIFPKDDYQSHWLVDQIATVSMLPDLKIRNERFRTDLKFSIGLDILKVYFQIAICASRASRFDENQIKEIVQNTISKQVYNANLTWSSAGNERHEDYDATFTIPISNQEAVRISYRL